MALLQEPWKYRIEPRQWIPAEGAWQLAKEHKANTWFLFGEKGGDTRVFGMFGSRFGAEDAAGKLTRGDLGEHYKGVLDVQDGKGVENGYQQALDQSAAMTPPNHKDRGIDR